MSLPTYIRIRRKLKIEEDTLSQIMNQSWKLDSLVVKITWILIDFKVSGNKWNRQKEDLQKSSETK